MSRENGVSAENNQPRMKENGIPKYSKGDRLLGSVSLAETMKKTPAAPKKPMLASQIQSLTETTSTKPPLTATRTAEPVSYTHLTLPTKA